MTSVAELSEWATVMVQVHAFERKISLQEATSDSKDDNEVLPLSFPNGNGSNAQAIGCVV